MSKRVQLLKKEYEDLAHAIDNASPMTILKFNLQSIMTDPESLHKGVNNLISHRVIKSVADLTQKIQQGGSKKPKVVFKYRKIGDKYIVIVDHFAIPGLGGK